MKGMDEEIFVLWDILPLGGNTIQSTHNRMHIFIKDWEIYVVNT